MRTTFPLPSKANQRTQEIADIKQELDKIKRKHPEQTNSKRRRNTQIQLAMSLQIQIRGGTAIDD